MGKLSSLRDELSLIVLRAVSEENIGLVDAAVACMGCAAIVLGAFPPAVRERLALELEGKLLEHANQRAKEIRSGELDRHLSQ